MPEFIKQGADGPAEEPLPQKKTGQKRQVVPQPQIAATQRKTGPKPDGEQPGTEEKLDKLWETAVQGPQGICEGTQQQAGQKTAGDPTPHQGGIQRRNPRLRLGSS